MDIILYTMFFALCKKAPLPVNEEIRNAAARDDNPVGSTWQPTHVEEHQAALRSKSTGGSHSAAWHVKKDRPYGGHFWQEAAAMHMNPQEVVFTTIEHAIDEVHLQMLRELSADGRTVTSPADDQEYRMPTLGGEKLEVTFVHMPDDPWTHEQIRTRLTVILTTPQARCGSLPLFQLEAITITHGVITVTEKWD